MEMKRAESEPGNKERVPSSGIYTYAICMHQVALAPVKKGKSIPLIKTTIKNYTKIKVRHGTRTLYIATP